MRNIPNGEQEGGKKARSNRAAIRYFKTAPNALLGHQPFLLENLESILWPWDMVFFGTDSPNYSKMRAAFAAYRDKNHKVISKGRNKGKRLKPLVIALKTEEENYHGK